MGNEITCEGKKGRRRRRHTATHKIFERTAAGAGYRTSAIGREGGEKEKVNIPNRRRIFYGKI